MLQKKKPLNEDLQQKSIELSCKNVCVSLVKEFEMK